MKLRDLILKAYRAFKPMCLVGAVASLFALGLAFAAHDKPLVAVLVAVGAMIAVDALADHRADQARADEAHFILSLLLRTGHTSIVIERKDQANG